MNKHGKYLIWKLYTTAVKIICWELVWNTYKSAKKKVTGRKHGKSRRVW